MLYEVDGREYLLVPAGRGPAGPAAAVAPDATLPAPPDASPVPSALPGYVAFALPIKK